MRLCKCGNKIPYITKIDGKTRNLANRTTCLICVPFGFRQPAKTPEEQLAKNRKKSRDWHKKATERTGIDFSTWRRLQRKTWLVTILGGSCQLCNYSKCLKNLALHHLYDKEEVAARRLYQLAAPKLVAEAMKCVLVCHNCHGEIHDNLVEVDLLEMNRSNIDLLKPYLNKGWDSILSN